MNLPPHFSKHTTNIDVNLQTIRTLLSESGSQVKELLKGKEVMAPVVFKWVIGQSKPAFQDVQEFLDHFMESLRRHLCLIENDFNLGYNPRGIRVINIM